MKRVAPPALPVWAWIAAGLLILGVIAAAGRTAEQEAAGGPAVTAPATTSPSATVVTTTTVSTTTTKPVPKLGERQNPIPAGVAIPLGNWTVEPLVVERDVNALVAAFNQFNDPPQAGNQYLRVRFRATFKGTGVGDPMFGFPDINIVGASGRTYGGGQSVAGGSGGDPDSLDDQAETFPGGVVEGWIYYQVAAADATGSLIAFSPDVKYSDVPGGVAFFALP